MAKKKLLPKNFDELLEKGDLNALKAVFDTCEVDARGGYDKQPAIAFDLCPDELVRWLNTSQAVSGEYAKFYQSFDSSFLDIFPQFIEQVNALLQPESHFAPRADASLTTELRILAAIRLGITDSGHIASLLNCASATVYTYRTKLRNAALDRDNFEQQVSRIGL